MRNGPPLRSRTAPLRALLTCLIGRRLEVRNRSMLPTLHPGDRIQVRTVRRRGRPLARGSLVVLQPANQTSPESVKRLVGLPGELVELRSGLLFVDGRPVPEPYVRRTGTDSGSWWLGADEYLVLGDNRPESTDSRHFGPVKAGRIRERVCRVYSSAGRQRDRARNIER